MTRGAGRPRTGQEVLTRDRILDAALGLVDREGMAALTMRRLAAELGVDPMSIYHHVNSKGAVVAGLVERLFGQLRTVPAAATAAPPNPQQRVRAFARTLRGLMSAHPDLLLAAVAQPAIAAAGVLAAGDELYAALEDAGLPPRLVVRGAAVVVDYVQGFALAERHTVNSAAGRRRLLEEMAARQPHELPALRRGLEAVSQVPPAEDSDDNTDDFDFGLDVLLSGLAQHLNTSGSASERHDSAPSDKPGA